MVTVVEGTLVAAAAHDVVREVVVAARVARVDKYVLRPVAKHEQEGVDDRREQHYPQEPRWIEEAKPRAGCSESNDGRCREGKEGIPPAPEGVQRELDPHEKKKAEPVCEKVKRIVALVRLRGRKVPAGSIVFRVVHDHVVEVIQAARDPEEGGENKCTQAV